MLVINPALPKVLSSTNSTYVDHSENPTHFCTPTPLPTDAFDSLPTRQTMSHQSSSQPIDPPTAEVSVGTSNAPSHTVRAAADGVSRGGRREGGTIIKNHSVLVDRSSQILSEFVSGKWYILLKPSLYYNSLSGYSS